MEAKHVDAVLGQPRGHGPGFFLFRRAIAAADVGAEEAGPIAVLEVEMAVGLYGDEAIDQYAWPTGRVILSMLALRVNPPDA